MSSSPPGTEHLLFFTLAPPLTPHPQTLQAAVPGVILGQYVNSHGWKWFRWFLWLPSLAALLGLNAQDHEQLGWIEAEGEGRWTVGVTMNDLCGFPL